MVKLKKRVAINKISHFFKTTPLVIFFHCSNRNYFYEKIRKLIALHQPILLSEIIQPHVLGGETMTNEQNIDFTSVKDSISEEDLIIKLVKNNYARKALLESKKLKKNDTVSSIKNSSSDFANTSIFLKKENSNGKDKGNDAFTANKKDKISSTSLFQCNNLLIGFKNIKMVKASNLMNELIDDENIHVLGGIYENSIIDHNQMKRLAQICGDTQIYRTLNNKLQNSTLTLITHLTKPFNLHFLLHPHYKVIALLKLLASNKQLAHKN